MPTDRHIAGLLLAAACLLRTMAVDAAETTLRLPALDRAKLAAEDQFNDGNGGPLRIAVAHDVDVLPTTHGEWTKANDGRLRWRLRVEAPGAQHLSFGLVDVELPEGAELQIIGADKGSRLGPWRSDDIPVHRELWTPVLQGDSAHLELYVPEPAREAVQLRLSRIAQGYRALGAESPTCKSGDCHLDVACLAFNDPWRARSNAVGTVVINGTGLCSGVLLNNSRRDGRLLFATASHCGIDDDATAASAVVYWHYRSSYCRIPGTNDNATALPRFGIVSSGLRLLARTPDPFVSSGPASDWTLIELAPEPGNPYGLVWAGWNFDAVPAACSVPGDDYSTTGLCAVIHHPSGDEQRITFSETPTAVSSIGMSAGTHWRAFWDTTPPLSPYFFAFALPPGVTEPGSSGAPLFNAAKEVVGVLSGGASFCGAPESQLFDGFGGLFDAWYGGNAIGTRMRDYLDPGQVVESQSATNLGSLSGNLPAAWQVGLSLPFVRALPGETVNLGLDFTRSTSRVYGFEVEASFDPGFLQFVATPLAVGGATVVDCLADNTNGRLLAIAREPFSTLPQGRYCTFAATVDAGAPPGGYLPLALRDPLAVGYLGVPLDGNVGHYGGGVTVGAATVPGAPVMDRAERYTDIVYVYFSTPADDGGRPITQYTLSSTPAHSGSSECYPGYCFVQGLANSVQYTFVVTATNEIGTSAPSAASNAIEFTVPDPPFMDQVYGYEGTVYIYFSPGSNGGRGITGYTVSSTPAGGTSSGCHPTFNYCWVEGLASSTPFTFTVVATNEVGTSASSAASNSIAFTEPSPPTAVQAELTNGFVRVDFSPPSDDGGYPINGYTATSSPGGISSNACYGNYCLVDGLTIGVEYTFTVTATNAVGASAPSAPSNPVLFKGVSYINFVNVPSLTVGGIGYIAAGIFGCQSGNPVRYASQTPAICSVSAQNNGKEITGLAVGACQITASVDASVDCDATSSLVELAVTPVPPVPHVANLRGIVQVESSSSSSACALNTAGEVYCWGSAYGVLLGADGRYASRIADLPPASSIAVGGDHACAISGGKVYCWGYNYYGQLGRGLPPETLYFSAQPNLVLGLENVNEIAAGYSHTCARLASGVVKCWGGNFSGELGDGSVDNKLVPVDVQNLGGAASRIAAGDAMSCAVLGGGQVKCWGYGLLNAALGFQSSSNPVPVDNLTNVAGLSVRSGNACAVIQDGSVKCWGGNFSGAVGDGTYDYRPSPVAVQGLGGLAASVVVGSSNAGFFSCARLQNGAVECWGANSRGELGDGTTAQRPTPAPVSGLSTATDLAAFYGAACALRSGGDVHCWGNNTGRQLGNGDTVGGGRSLPSKITGLLATKLSLGQNWSCALTTGGEVRCWGNNESAQLGDGSRTNRSTPASSVLPSAASDVAAGRYGHTCFRVSGGELRCAGYGGYGQLGDGTFLDRTEAVVVSGLESGTLSVDAGNYHSCAVNGSALPVCWGYGYGGQLGTGAQENTVGSPVAVSGLSDVAEVALGASHSCARTNAGAAACWGENWNGQVGDGTNDLRLAPTQVSGLSSGVAQIDASYSGTCAALSSGEASCWGQGVTTPRLVENLPDDVAEVAVGDYFTCARSQSGAVRCWGSNDAGQLGIGSNNYGFLPVEVARMESNVAAVAAGGSHACAIKTNNEVWCWGNNDYGQLGLGIADELFVATPGAVRLPTTGPTLAPTPVSGATISVSGGAVGASFTRQVVFSASGGTVGANAALACSVSGAVQLGGGASQLVVSGTSSSPVVVTGSFAATPQTGTLDCSVTPEGGSATAHSFNFSIAVGTYSLTYAAGAGGTISGVASQNVVPGGSGSAVTATPNSGFRFIKWSDESTVNPRTDSNVTANLAVTASFSNTHTVTSSAGPNGSIDPAGPQTVTQGDTVSFQVTPSAGFAASVGGTCGGNLNVATGVYTTVPVTSSCTVQATFALRTYVVTANAGANGSIAPSTREVNHGSTTTFTVTPNVGYEASSVTGCAGALSGTTYVTGPITSACTVQASFSLVSHVVSTTVVGANGRISPSSQSVQHGSTANFTVDPDNGFEAVVNGCGGALDGATYRTAAIVAPCTVTASFSDQKFTVTPSVAGGNGSITPQAAELVTAGTTKTYFLSPASGYVSRVAGSCGGTLVGNVFVTNPINANCTVVASFVLGRLISPSAAFGGNIIPNTQQTIDPALSFTFNVRARPGFNVRTPVAGSCGGNLNGAGGNFSYAINIGSADCDVRAEFIEDVVPLAPRTNKDVIEARLSGNGRFVVFESQDPSLHVPCGEPPNSQAPLCGAGGTNCPAGGVLYVFRRDTENNCTDLVNLDAQGKLIRIATKAKGGESDPDFGKASISGNGDWISFVAPDSGIGKFSGETDDDARKRQKANCPRVSLRNALTGSFIPVGCAAPAAPAGPGTPPVDGGRPVVAPDGRSVTFTGIYGGKPAVMQQQIDVVGQVVGTFCVSCVPPGGAASGAPQSFTEPLDGFAHNAAVSATGEWVAYQTIAKNAVPAAPNACNNGASNSSIVLRNMLTGFRRTVSLPQNIACQLGSASKPSIDYSGTRVVFESTQPLTAGATSQAEAYLFDTSTGQMQRLSTPAAGGLANGDSGGAAISGDGRRIVFTSAASTSFGANPSGLKQVIARDLSTGAVRRLSESAFGVVADADSRRLSLSYSGEAVSFDSAATNLAGSSTNVDPLTTVFLRANPDARNVVFGSGFD